MIITRRCASDTVGQTAGARQMLEQSLTWVSNNIDKQLLKADGGGISNRRGEIPGFLPERGFLDRIILIVTLDCWDAQMLSKFLERFIDSFDKDI